MSNSSRPSTIVPSSKRTAVDDVGWLGVGLLDPQTEQPAPRRFASRRMNLTVGVDDARSRRGDQHATAVDELGEQRLTAGGADDVKQRSDDNRRTCRTGRGGNDVDDPSPFDERPMGVANGLEVSAIAGRARGCCGGPTSSPSRRSRRSGRPPRGCPAAPPAPAAHFRGGSARRRHEYRGGQIAGSDAEWLSSAPARACRIWKYNMPRDPWAIA